MILILILSLAHYPAFLSCRYFGLLNIIINVDNQREITEMPLPCRIYGGASVILAKVAFFAKPVPAGHC